MLRQTLYKLGRIIVVMFFFSGLFAEAVLASSPPVYVQLAAGNSHSVALLSDGTVKTWGYSVGGQLGYPGGDAYTPTTVPGLQNVIAIGAGAGHTVALQSDGTVKAWGANNHGQIGNGSVGGGSVTPTTVLGLTSVVAIAAGADFNLALLADGTVKAWGGNQYGQLGDGNTTTNSGTPVTVRGLSQVVAVAVGLDHSLALLADGTVRAWGRNQNGELGNGTTTSSTSPVAVVGFGSYRVTAIATRGNHNLALLDNGTVMAWGDNYKRQLGIGSAPDSNTAVAVPSLNQVTAITTGVDHSFALLADGSLKGWGYNIFRRTTDSADSFIDNPVTIGGLGAPAVAAAGGEGHSLVLLADGTVKAWGYNNKGQLGTTVPGGAYQSGPPLTVVAGQGAYRVAPTLKHAVNGLNVDVDWSPVAGATGYTLLFAYYPYKPGDTIYSLDMWSQQGLNVDLWAGAAFYIAVQARNPYGSSYYSNIGLFQLQGP